ncbi:MAG: acyl-CoA dehydrogenase [Thermoleophilia bacterium]|nr:acyl-CoA dehydrogenase [Thermoleophilia bacterium]
MDLTFTEEERAFRREAREWLEANVPPGPHPSGDTREGFAFCKHWEQKLAGARWAVVSWPERYGGRDATLFEWLVFEEEYYRASAPQRVSQNGIFLLAPTLFEFGSEEQKDRILPAMAAARVLWAQGWSEPGAGSDLASLRSTAVRDEARGGWRLNGQKTWCTRAAFCDHLFGLFRTSTSAEQARHKGLTYFLVDLRAPGVTVRPVARLDGDEGFADVFVEDVFVPDRDVLGGVDEGWSVAMATASSERGLSLRSPGRFVATACRLRELYLRMRAIRGKSAVSACRERVVDALLDAEAYRLHTFQTVTKLVETAKPLGPEASLTKLFWSEMDLASHETALELLGDRAPLVDGADGAVDHGAWMKGFEFALAGPIYAGTNEIQRNVVAERVLGLPRK